MSEEKENLSLLYSYLPAHAKKDFALLYKQYGVHLNVDNIEQWNNDMGIGLKVYQMDDLLHISVEVLKEWDKL
jgi:hypothetical protein